MVGWRNETGGAQSNITEKSYLNWILKDVLALFRRKHTDYCNEMKLCYPGSLGKELIDRKHLREHIWLISKEDELREARINHTVPASHCTI